MRVLMFGWEFPPYSKGGLGTACYGLTKGLVENNIEISFVVPASVENYNGSFLNLIGLDTKSFSVNQINSLISQYMTPLEYNYKKSNVSKDLYGSNLFEEVELYASRSKSVIETENFDVIHSHDWLTYKAGILAKKISNKPLVIHVHATEFDRTGGNVNSHVYNIEREGMINADKIIAVSNFTKNKIIENYKIDPDKIVVVHNAVTPKNMYGKTISKNKNEKIVLFLGRITLQKGPEYFIKAASKVVDFIPNVKFVVSGTGEMLPSVIDLAIEYGLSEKIFYTGHLTESLDSMYAMSDVYVMPSVSEPFGITPLEAMRNGTPVIISKQSGVSEVIKNCFKVDFWDINQMASQIISVLKYDELREELSINSLEEIKKFDWNVPAKKCADLYYEVTKVA